MISKEQAREQLAIFLTCFLVVCTSLPCVLAGIASSTFHYCACVVD